MKFFKSGEELFSPRIGQLHGLYDFGTDQLNEQAHAVIAPGGIPSPKLLTQTTSTAPMATPTRHCCARRRSGLA